MTVVSIGYISKYIDSSSDTRIRETNEGMLGKTALLKLLVAIQGLSARECLCTHTPGLKFLRCYSLTIYTVLG
jgi:hypothetical protein